MAIQRTFLSVLLLCTSFYCLRCDPYLKKAQKDVWSAQLEAGAVHWDAQERRYLVEVHVKNHTLHPESRIYVGCMLLPQVPNDVRAIASAFNIDNASFLPEGAQIILDDRQPSLPQIGKMTGSPGAREDLAHAWAAPVLIEQSTRTAFAGKAQHRRIVSVHTPVEVQDETQEHSLGIENLRLALVKLPGGRWPQDKTSIHSIGKDLQDIQQKLMDFIQDVSRLRHADDIQQMRSIVRIVQNFAGAGRAEVPTQQEAKESLERLQGSVGRAKRGEASRNDIQVCTQLLKSKGILGHMENASPR